MVIKKSLIPAIVLSSVMIATLFTPYTAMAISESLKEFYIDNDIPFYTDTDTNTCSASTLAVKLSGDRNDEKIWNYLASEGLSAEQIAGIMGNIKTESGYSPTRQEVKPLSHSGKGGWGLAQWTGGRRTAIVKYIEKQDSSLLKYESDTSSYGGAVTKKNGYKHPSVPEEDNDTLLKLELDYLIQELKSRKVGGYKSRTSAHVSMHEKYGGMTEWDAIMKASSIRDVANILLISFERPADQSTKHQNTRTENAENVFSELQGSTPGSSTGSTVTSYDCDETSRADVSGFEGTVIDFVLPDYHRKPYTGKDKAMPAYVEAADYAKSNGLFTGNGASPWYADCGGFVTTLIHESGWDTNYNYERKHSKGASSTTAGQYPWLRKNWESLGMDSSIDVADLQPGDVWIKNGHTFIFIGDIPGINSNRASASNMERVPMAGTERLTNNGGEWFRKK